MSSEKKKGAAEARAAMGELVGELDRTRKEFAKATLQLTHLETTVQHLKDTETKQDQVIAHLESELERRDAAFKEEISILQEEARTKEAAHAHRNKFLELEVERLKQEVEVANLFEKENRQLRDTVLENQATIEKLQVMNEELRARAKEEAKDHTAQLEAEFKRRLADAEKKFRAEAYRALSEEAKIALQGNDHLQTVLQRQNDSIEAVLLKCKHLEQSHAKIVGEQEISTQNLQHHMAEIQRLKKQLGDAKSRNTQLEDQLRQRKVERASLELLFLEYESTRKQLTKERERSRRALREAERWRNRSLQLTQELTGEQREAAEAKLQAITAHGDTVEAHLEKTRRRAEKKDRERARNAEGAALLRGARGSPDPLGDDKGDTWSQVSEDDVLAAEPSVAAGGVNPMEILSMWNANFAMYDNTAASGLGPSAGTDAAGPGTASGAPGASDVGVDAGAAPPAGDHSLVDGVSGAGVASGVPDPAGDGIDGVKMRSTLGASAVAGGAHSAGSTPRVLVGGGLAPRPPQPLGAVRPPAGALSASAGPLGGTVDARRAAQNAKLSVLAQPKASALPPPARAFAAQKSTLLAKHERMRHQVMPAGELSVVSHGEFKVAKPRLEPGAQRFLVP